MPPHHTVTAHQPDPDLPDGQDPTQAELPTRTEAFINYRGGADSPYAANLLYAGLSHVWGPDRVFLDSESIKPGVDFVTTLMDRVRATRIVLALVGPCWLTVSGVDGRRCIDDPDDWIRRELVAAFDAGVPVIPVLTDNASMPTVADLPADIARLGRAQYMVLRQRYAQADIALLLDHLSRPSPARGATSACCTGTSG